MRNTGVIEMGEYCVVYPERSDYRENEMWLYYIVGEELSEELI